MSLATRCPACGTAFRVVQDQLRVSGGWVRCGQCHQVFNGLESLQELPPPAPPPPPPPPPPAPAPAPAVESFESIDALAAPDEPPPSSDVESGFVTAEGGDDFELSFDAADRRAAPPPEADSAGEPIPAGLVVEGDTGWSAFDRLAATSRHDGPASVAPDPGFNPVLRGVALPANAGAGISTFGEVAAATAAASQPPSDALDQSPEATAPEPEPRRGRRRKPAFMRQAERAAQWRRPAVRAVLAGTSVLLAAVLALQVVHHRRDDLAARVPALQTPLQAWCELAHCRLEPPRDIARLVIDSSSLQRTETPQVLRFEAELHNSAEHLVRAPALELSFNDNQGRTLVRKVLLPEALSAPPEGIAADGVWHVSARLRVGTLPVTGFSAEVFYP